MYRYCASTVTVGLATCLSEDDKICGDLKEIVIFLFNFLFVSCFPR